MENLNEETKEFLTKMGPYIHMTLFHHHNISMKANKIDEPKDDEIVTFTWEDGSEYNVRYSKLKELAISEQENFINDNKSTNQ